MTKEALVRDLQKRIESAGSQYRVADSLEVSNSHLTDVLQGRRDPGPKLLRALGLTKVVTYQKAATK
jgi:hypothetical protein